MADAKSTIFGSKWNKEKKKKVIKVLYFGRNLRLLSNRKAGERPQSMKILTRLTSSTLLFEDMQERKRKEQSGRPLVAAPVKVTVSFRAVTSAARLESRYPQPWGIAGGRINMPQKRSEGKLNPETGKLSLNGKQSDKGK